MPLSFQTWFASNVRCPICRYDIRTHVSDAEPSIDRGQQENNQVSDENISDAGLDGDANDDVSDDTNNDANDDVNDDANDGGGDSDSEPRSPIPFSPQEQPSVPSGTDVGPVMEGLLVNAVRSMLNTTPQETEESINTTLSGILANITTNHADNVVYDSSNNSLRLETTVWSSDNSWNMIP